MIYIKRFKTNEDGTLGMVYNGEEFLCFTLEDPIRLSKVVGDSAIPAQIYDLKKRTYGRFYDAYRERWGHGFVVEILHVPHFEDVLFHTGNTKADTRGCILLGEGCDADQMQVSRSRPAYVKFFDLLDGMETLPALNVMNYLVGP